MFCENCGTRVEDGQPFCPNCGNRMGAPETPAAPVNPGFEPNANAGYVPPAAPAAKRLPSTDGLLGKINAMQGLEKIFYLCVCGLLVVCFILFLLKVFSPGYGSYQFSAASPFFSTVITVLMTLSITFFVLDYFDKFTFKFLWFFIAGAAAVIFIIFLIVWIDADSKLSAGGWFFLIFQAGLTATAVLLLLEKLKKK
jgi:hypothetical protein